MKLCALILKPAAAGPQRKRVVSILNEENEYRNGFFLNHTMHSLLSFWLCQTLVKESVVHPLECEPGQFLPQTEQKLLPSPSPSPSRPPPGALQTPSSQSGQARISLAISVGPAPFLPSAVTRSTLLPRSPTLEDGMRGRQGWREHNGGRERFGVTKERARGRLSQQKERKATQMLAMVLGETVI